MEEFKFTAEMFKEATIRGCFKAAEIANAKLKEHLDKCPTVYGFNNRPSGWMPIIFGNETHEAKLFNIKTITEGE